MKRQPRTTSTGAADLFVIARECVRMLCAIWVLSSIITSDNLFVTCFH